MKVARLRLPTLLFLIVGVCSVNGSGQSTSQDYPTPVLTNEISGTIKARSIGDSRLTTHYYTFNGEQGDVFINLVTRNLTGDIDVFTVSGLRPVTKIAVYADYAESETGRAVYLRKHEKLILRIQGRTPNDDDAFYRIKFAGSFAAVRPEDVQPAPEMPRVASQTRSEEKAAEVEKTDVPATEVKEKAPDEKAAEEKKAVVPAERTEDKKDEGEVKKAAEPEPKEPVLEKKTEVVVTDPLVTKPEVDKPAEAETKKTELSPEPPTRTTARRRARRTTRTPPDRTPVEPKPDPLASVNLSIRFKDGNSLELKLSEVRRFTVDRGVLVVTLRSGKISRYSIADVSKVTIE